MTPLEREIRSRRTSEALGALVRGAVEEPLPHADPARRDRFLEALPLPSPRSSRLARVATVGAVAASALIAVLWFVWEAPSMRYRVGPGNGGTGEYIRAVRAPVDIAFSDGSRAVFEAGARGRIGGVTSRGANIAVDLGRVDMDVHHEDGTDWAITAGPYTVAVVGTRFSIAWDAERENLELSMREGRVKVRGPGIVGDLELQAGQRMVSRLREGDVVVSRIEAAEQKVSQARAPAPVEPASPVEDASRAKPSAGSVDGDPDAIPAKDRAQRNSPSAVGWKEHIARGEFDAVVDEAEAAGISATLASAPLEDLVALADASRYLRRPELAARSLTAQRKRFPGTADAIEASFLLGRIADERGDSKSAATYYERYVAEAPKGALIEEALGRAMMANERNGQRARAREIAERYAATYTQGAFRAAAERLIEGP